MYVCFIFLPPFPRTSIVFHNFLHTTQFPAPFFSYSFSSSCFQSPFFSTLSKLSHFSISSVFSYLRHYIQHLPFLSFSSSCFQSPFFSSILPQTFPFIFVLPSPPSQSCTLSPSCRPLCLGRRGSVSAVPRTASLCQLCHLRAHILSHTRTLPPNSPLTTTVFMWFPFLPVFLI